MATFLGSQNLRFRISYRGAPGSRGTRAEWQALFGAVPSCLVAGGSGPSHWPGLSCSVLGKPHSVARSGPTRLHTQLFAFQLPSRLCRHGSIGLEL